MDELAIRSDEETGLVMQRRIGGACSGEVEIARGLQSAAVANENTGFVARFRCPVDCNGVVGAVFVKKDFQEFSKSTS